jgi:hypothetical protein
MSRFSFVCVSLAFLTSNVALTGAEVESGPLAFASCAEDLQLPRDVPPMSAPEMDRPINVKIIPASDGRPKSISIEGGTAAAKILIKSWMSSSTFAKSCAGKELTIQFSFSREGPPIDYPFIWVTFAGPNHFIIHMRNRNPSTFRLPPTGMPAEKKE